MHGLISWFARNGVAANLLMIVIIVMGAMTIPRLKKEVFPEYAIDMVTVSVDFRGGTPEEIEETVCIRIEEEIQDLDGIKKITSTAAEGNGTVSVEVAPGYDSRRLLDDVKSRVDSIDAFPDETEKPVVREILNRRQVINVSISGNTDEKTLKRLGEQVRDEIMDLPGITHAELVNARDYEISIEVSEEALRRHNLTFDFVAQSVRRFSLDLPGGSLKTETGDILLRTKGQAYVGQDFEKLPLLTKPDGTKLYLEDVATVVDGFTDTDEWAFFNGKPSMMVSVFRVGDQNAITVSETIHDYVEQARARMPEGIAIEVWKDNASFLRGRIDLLLRNAANGLVLVFIVLALFLRMQLAFWVTIGIPISFLGALALMPMYGGSINMISLFAMILVLGIVVDDAIVVGESIFTEQRRGNRGVEGSIRGTRIVGVPVIFGVLTTVAAFSPMLFLPGYMGKIWRMIPLAVIPALLFSLIESQLVLPHHLSWTRTHSDQGPASESAGENVDRVFRILRRGAAVVHPEHLRAGAQTHAELALCDDGGGCGGAHVDPGFGRRRLPGVHVLPASRGGLCHRNGHVSPGNSGDGNRAGGQENAGVGGASAAADRCRVGREGVSASAGVGGKSARDDGEPSKHGCEDSGRRRFPHR